MLSSLAERALMLRYRLSDGRSWKRLWEGWVGSFTMLLVLLEHRARKMSRMDGRGAPMIFAAVFHCCHPWLLVCTCGDGLGDCHIISPLFDVSSHSFSVLLQVCVVVVGGRLFKHVPVCALKAVL